MEVNFTPVEGKEEKELIEKYFVDITMPGYIRCQGTLVPDTYRKYATEILNLQVRDDDIWVCSFPKCGTTWTQEMVWCIANNLDFEGAKVNITERFPFLEMGALYDFENISRVHPDKPIANQRRESIRIVKEMPSPRFIKTHLPFHLLPLQLQQRTTKAKLVYVSRNAKDTCVSFYYHNRRLHACKASLEEFAQAFIKDSVLYAPFWDHILGYWNVQQHQNFLFLKFEDMKKDLPSVVRKTADFLGKTLSEAQIATLCHHLSFDEMKKSDAVNYQASAKFAKTLFPDADGVFMRSGQVGESATQLSPQWIQRFDKWTTENLKGYELSL